MVIAVLRFDFLLLRKEFKSAMATDHSSTVALHFGKYIMQNSVEKCIKMVEMQGSCFFSYNKHRLVFCLLFVIANLNSFSLNSYFRCPRVSMLLCQILSPLYQQ